METQCKSCGSVKFEYKEDKKVCAYCGREVYNNNLEIVAIEDHLAQLKNQMDLDRRLLQFHTIIDPTRTISFLPPIF